MDIKVFKTFLEVAKAKHFGKSAENLYITQAAVSARIKQLEEYYATKLFIRDKSNIRLTAAGERLYEHVLVIVEQLTQSKLNLSLLEHNQVLLNIAATPNVWDAFLAPRIAPLIFDHSELSLGAEISVRESIHRRLLDKTLDVAVLLDPIKEDEFINEAIGTLDLVLVSTDANASECELQQYIMVDWGMAFHKEHKLSHKIVPILRTSTAKIALDIMLQNGGAAYLPYALVEQLIADQKLYVLNSQLNISRHIYFTYHKNSVFPEKIANMAAQLKNIGG